MVPDYVRISNFHLDALIISNITETHSVPLWRKRKGLVKLDHGGCRQQRLTSLTLCAAKHASSFSSAFFAYSKASNVSCFFCSASMSGRRDRSRDARASLHRTSASSLDEHKVIQIYVTKASFVDISGPCNYKVEHGPFRRSFRNAHGYLKSLCGPWWS